MDSTQPTYYTCTPYTTPEILRTSGIEPIELTIQYIYEVDVLPNKPLDLAIQHVSTTLLRRIATVGNLVECNGTADSSNNPFRRRLRFRGRGSNSLLGIEASDDGRLDSEQVCQFQTSGGEQEEVEQFLDGVTGDFSGSVILEAQVDASHDGDREEDRDGDVVLAETRVDGVIYPASVIRSALPQNKEKVESEEEGGAFNYLSTQSEIKEAVPKRTQPTVGEKNIIGSVSYRPDPISKLRTGLGTKCNVIQGQITLFISNTADPFENLDGRILEAIKDDLNDEMIVQQEFLTDEVVGIRLLEPALVDKAVLPSLPSVDTTEPVQAAPVPAPVVASAAASAPSNIDPSSGFASSNASIGVIGGLGAIFLMLVGLFAYTAKPRKKRRYRLGSHDNDLKPIQYDDDEYEDDLDGVAGVMGETESTASWWQEPVRVTRTATGSSFPTIEASYSNNGIVIGDDDDTDEEVVANDKSPKVLPLSFFSNKKSKASEKEMDDTSKIMGDLIKSESLLDDDRSSSTIDMDAHLHQDVEKSKKPKSLLGRRLFGRKRTNDDDDVLIDDDVIIEEASLRADSQDKGIETTTPFHAIAAYPSPSSVSSRTPPRSLSRASRSRSNNSDRILQTSSSGAFSCIPGLPSPEIGDDQTDVSALTDNYTAFYARRGPPQCAQNDGEQLMRLATDVVRQCIAPTTDNISVGVPGSVGTSSRQQQLARRQRNGDADAFADCWNPFEGNFWQGWFE